jgi:isopentenyl phosphate kinase
MALVFLKLGGSLITEKTRPYTPRNEKIEDLVSQVAAALQSDPKLRLVLGHGSGSFGHEAASKFDTQHGVSSPAGWQGFAEVWFQASRLNRIVIESLHRAGLPAVTFSPAASVTSRDGKVVSWDVSPIHSALDNGLLPVVHGDVAFDLTLGGTIISTETLFIHLARELKPARILLAGREAGVWADFPSRRLLIEEISPASLPQVLSSLGGAAEADVTGGMKSKVLDMLALVDELPGLEALIFSAEPPAMLRRALAGENPGTLLHR